MHVLPANTENLEAAIGILRGGGIVAHATETCYGLACDLTNEDAVRRLFALKKRPEDQPVSALFPSVEEAKKCVEWNDLAEQLARKHLPGPLTLILPLRATVSSFFFTPRELSTRTLAVRISSHPIARKLAGLSGIPLSTTSANLHGKPETYSVKEIMDQFVGARLAVPLQPDLILDSGPLPHTSPSTIVDLTDGTAKILRQGGTVI